MSDVDLLTPYRNVTGIDWGMTTSFRTRHPQPSEAELEALDRRIEAAQVARDWAGYATAAEMDRAADEQYGRAL